MHVEVCYTTHVSIAPCHRIVILCRFYTFGEVFSFLYYDRLRIYRRNFCAGRYTRERLVTPELYSHQPFVSFVRATQ